MTTYDLWFLRNALRNRLMFFVGFSRLQRDKEVPRGQLFSLVARKGLMLPIKTMCKIKPRPVGLCYQNSVNQRSGMSLYLSTPSLSKFEQLNWPALMLPIKLFQFKICELADTDDM